MDESLDFIGKNIRFFRRSRNWTLADLASRIGIQEGPLGRIERGMNLPSAIVIYRLTQVLDIPADALFAPEMSQSRAAAGDADSLWVTIDPEPVIPPKPLLTACHQIMTAFHALEDILGVQKHAYIPLTVPFEPDYPGMDTLAAKVRNCLGVRDAVVFDYLELLENAGLRIILFPFMTAASPWEALSFYEPFHHNAFFFVNSRNNPEKQLFSLARELGKILIFNQMGNRKDRLFPPEDQNPEPRPINARRAAKRFASTFLMPETAVRATTSQLGITTDTWSWDLLLRIKHRFGLSVEAFLYRLNELDLISENLSRKFQARIKEHYDQTGFGEPDASRRILNANGRFFDLLLTAENVKTAQQEVDNIKEMTEKIKIVKM